MHLSSMYLNHVTAKQEKKDSDFIQQYILALKYLASLLILAIKMNFNCIQAFSQIKMDFSGNCKYYQELKHDGHWRWTLFRGSTGFKRLIWAPPAAVVGLALQYGRVFHLYTLFSPTLKTCFVT